MSPSLSESSSEQLLSLRQGAQGEVGAVPMLPCHPQQRDSHQTQDDHVGLGALSKVRFSINTFTIPLGDMVGGLSNFHVIQRSPGLEESRALASSHPTKALSR